MSCQNVQNYGAVGDGETLDTAALQAAIDAVDHVIIPPGIYLTGTLYLHDNTVLELEYGALLRASGNMENYNAPDFCPQNPVSKLEHTNGGHLITAVNCKNIVITGGGRIDGASENWFIELDPIWQNTVYEKYKMPEIRPAQLLYFCECENIRLNNIEIYSAPYWSCFFHGCCDVRVHDVKIRTDKRGHNGDGIGLDCVRNAIISDCDIDTSDDCITLRSCSAKLSQPFNCENIVVTNCILSSRQAGIRIGLGTGTAIRNAVFSNIIVRHGTYGVMICASWYYDQGAVISGIDFCQLRLNAHRPLVITTQCASETIGNGIVRDISFRHIRGMGTYPCGITGNSKHPITDITLEDIYLDYPDVPGGGVWGNFTQAKDNIFFITHAQMVEINRMKIFRHPKWNSGIKIADANVICHDCYGDEPPRLPGTADWIQDKDGNVIANFFR